MKKEILISQDLYEKINKRYEKEKNSLLVININSVDEFIEYILKNFESSSEQFENLTQEQKEALNNIDISNLNVDDIFNSISDSLSKDDNTKQEKNMKKKN